MSTTILKDMLFINDPSVLKLYKELITISGYFIGPVFTIAIVIEFFAEMDFASVLKKLLIVVLFMGSFYGFHTKAVELSLETASKTLHRVSPNNIFVKNWYKEKVKTKTRKSWNVFQALAIPNLNDLVATLFFVLSKIFIWLLKLIYSSVYHLTYVFAGFTAILYFLGWTKDALKGTIQASLWCMILPFVIVSILALVGNSMEDSASIGKVAYGGIDNLVWLFGVTLLLLISPLITYGMINGEGIHSAGAKMGSLVLRSGTQAMAVMPMASKIGSSTKFALKQGSRKASRFASNLKTFGGSTKSNSNPRMTNLGAREMNNFNRGTSQTATPVEQKSITTQTGSNQVKKTSTVNKNQTRRAVRPEGSTPKEAKTKISQNTKTITRRDNELRKFSGSFHERKPKA